MDCSSPGSSVHGILQERILEWVAVSFSRGSSWPRDWICVTCLAGRFFTTEPPGKPLYQFSSVQSRSHVWLFATPWIAAHQASLSITNSQSSFRLTPIDSVMPSSHLMLCHPIFLLPLILPSIRVFSNESTLRMRWPKYWSFSFSIIPSKDQPGLISLDWKEIQPVHSEGDQVFFWNSTAYSMIQQMLAIWSLVPLPFLKIAWTSESSKFTYCWSLAWRILSITFLTCDMSAIVR